MGAALYVSARFMRDASLIYSGYWMGLQSWGIFATCIAVALLSSAVSEIYREDREF